MLAHTHAVSPPIAPWAERVPGMGLVTVDLLLTLPDDGYIYEVVEGALVRMAGSGRLCSIIGGLIYAALVTYARPARLGVVTPADGVYKLVGAETGLIPDAAFYSAARDATIARSDDDKPIPFAPDLAVEVASPSQSANEMAAKARLYLSGGTRLVWIVWPSAHHVDVWRHDHPSGPVRTLNAGDALDGEDVVPGFTHPLADIFAGPLG